MKKMLFILLLATIGFAQVGIDYIPIWYGKKVIICPDTGLWSVDILPDDANVRNIGSPDLPFNTLYVTSLGGQNLFVNGLDTIATWYRSGYGDNYGLLIKPNYTNDSLNSDIWIDDTLVDVNRKGISISLHGAGSNDVIYGISNSLEYTGSGTAIYGNYNNINNGKGVSDQYGVVYGYYNDISVRSGGGVSYGFYNKIHNLAGTSNFYGIWNHIENEDPASGDMVGVYNNLLPCGEGNKIGIKNALVDGSGTDSIFGEWTAIDGSASTNNHPLFGNLVQVITYDSDTGYAFKGITSGTGVNFGALIEPNVLIKDGDDTIKIGPGYMKDGLRNAPGNKTSDTLVLPGLSNNWRAQVTWYGSTAAISPIRAICKTDSLIIFYEIADSTRARTDGYYYSLTNY